MCFVVRFMSPEVRDNHTQLPIALARRRVNVVWGCYAMGLPLKPNLQLDIFIEIPFVDMHIRNMWFVRRPGSSPRPEFWPAACFFSLV